MNTCAGYNRGNILLVMRNGTAELVRQSYYFHLSASYQIGKKSFLKFSHHDKSNIPLGLQYLVLLVPGYFNMLLHLH